MTAKARWEGFRATTGRPASRPEPSEVWKYYRLCAWEDIAFERKKGGSQSPKSLAHRLDCLPPELSFFASMLSTSHAVLVLGGLYKFASYVGVDKTIRIDLSTEGPVSPYIHEGLS